MPTGPETVDEEAGRDIRTLGVIVNAGKPRAREVTERIFSTCERLDVPVLVENGPFGLGGLSAPSVQAVDAATLGERSDVVVACGGDGTILRAARLVMDDPRPILGVNLGTLGFLAELSPEQIEHGLACIMRGEFTLRHRMTLQAQVNGKDGVYGALNDIIIAKSNQSRIISLETYEGGRWVNTYVADGLILATPTGSTAYALSAGGPIVTPRLKAITTAPICPHSLTVRPMVFDASAQLEIRVVASSESTILLSADGQEAETLASRESVIVRRGPKDTLLIRLESSSYYDILRQKLHWGADKTLNGNPGE